MSTSLTNKINISHAMHTACNLLPMKHKVLDEMDSWETLRAMIKEERRKVSGKSFGEKLGFDKSYISRLESGKAQFSEEILNRLAEYFGKPVHELCTPTSETEKFTREIKAMEEMKAMFEQMLEDRDLKDILIGEWKKLRRIGQLPVTDKKKE